MSLIRILFLLILICPTIWAGEQKQQDAQQQAAQQDEKLKKEAKLRKIVEAQMERNNRSGFRLAAKYGFVDFMHTILLHTHLNIFTYDQHDEDGKYALAFAIENDQVAVVKYLLDVYEKYIVQKPFDKQRFYTRCATILGTFREKAGESHKASLALLEKFVDTHAFRFAVEQGDISTLEALYKKNPDLINAGVWRYHSNVDQPRTSMICYAANMEVGDSEYRWKMVRWLAERKAQVYDPFDYTPIQPVLNTTEITRQEREELVKILCSYGQQWTDESRKKLLLIYLWHREYNPEIVRLLLEYGADPNYVDPLGGCPLFRANDECAKILCDHGATIDARDAHGNTVLMNVCADQRMFMFFRLKKLLKDFRPDITIKNNNGQDARAIAQIYNPSFVFALDNYVQSAQGKPVTPEQAARQRKAEIAALAKKADDQDFCKRYQRSDDFYHKRISLLDNPDSLLSRAYDLLDDEGREFERLLHLVDDEYEQEEKKAQEPERLAKEKEDKAREERQAREQVDRQAKERAEREAKEKAEHEAKVKADKETQRILKRLEKEELAYREKLKRERDARERPMVGERVPDGIAQFVKQNLAQQAKKQEELAEEQELDLVALQERVSLQARKKKEKEERKQKKTVDRILSLIIDRAVEQGERNEQERQEKEKAEREYKERSAKVRSEGGKSSLLLDKCSSLKDAVDTYCWQQAQEGNLVKLEDVPAITKQIARTWIFEAIARGDLDGVKNCIEQYNVDINARDTLGRRKGTPLHVAVNAQQPAIVEYLLGRDADFRMMDAHQKTAGFWAEELLRESPSKLSARVLECFKANVLSDHHIKRVIKEVSDKWVSSSVLQKKTEDAPGMLPLVAALASSSLAPMPTVRGVMSHADVERRLMGKH